MDKYEFRVSIDEIDRLIEDHRFKEAAAIADKIDWTKVRGTFILCRISDLYKINKRYKESRDLLEIAYERKPSSRKIIYSLCELELKLNNYIHALQLYNAFINVAPRNSDRFLLQYKLYKKQEVNVYEQISVLEEFLRHDFREKYAYELAVLYLKAGDEQHCARQCDEIVTYFGYGRFVIRALELKQSFTQLTPQQEEHLEVLRSGGKYVPPKPAQETETSGQEENSGTAEDKKDESAKNDRNKFAEDDGNKSAADEGKGSANNDGKGSAKNDGNKSAEDDEKESSKNNGNKFPKNDGNKFAEDDGNEAAGYEEYDYTEINKNGSAAENSEETSGKIPAASIDDVDAAREDGSLKAAEEKRQSAPSMDEEDDQDIADDSEPAGNPEEYTDTLLSDVKMQETIARGMREIDDYDNVLAQETSGQFTMAIEEEPLEEQSESQLNLEQIMSEWEKIRRNSEQQRLAEARRRVMETSDAVKRELYGDDFADDSDDKKESVPEAGDNAVTGDTRSWDSEDVKRRMK